MLNQFELNEYSLSKQTLRKRDIARPTCETIGKYSMLLCFYASMLLCFYAFLSFLEIEKPEIYIIFFSNADLLSKHAKDEGEKQVLEWIATSGAWKNALCQSSENVTKLLDSISHRFSLSVCHG